MDANPIMTAAWCDFLHFAIGSEPLRARFEEQTGTRFAVDAETTVEDFALWVTLDQWGDEGVPPAFLGKANERFPA